MPDYPGAPGSAVLPRTRPSISLRLPLGTGAFMAGLAAAAFVIFAGAAGLVAFRLGAQFMAETDLSGPARWLYEAGGFVAAPFRASETAPNAGSGHVIEFSTLVALEAYLIAGSMLVVVIAAFSLLARGSRPRSLTLRLDLSGPAESWRALAPSLMAFSADVETRAERVTGDAARAARAAGETAVIARDWLRAATAVTARAIAGLPDAGRRRLDTLKARRRQINERLHAATEMLQPVAGWSRERASKALAGVRDRIVSPPGGRA